jgi:hypothetical protein
MGYCTYNGQKVPGNINQAVCEDGGVGTWVTGSEAPADDRGFLKRYWQDTSGGKKALDAALLASIPLTMGASTPVAATLGAGRVALAGAGNAGRIAGLMGRMKQGGGWLRDKLLKTQKPQTYANNPANVAAGRAGQNIPQMERVAGRGKLIRPATKDHYITMANGKKVLIKGKPAKYGPKMAQVKNAAGQPVFASRSAYSAGKMAGLGGLGAVAGLGGYTPEAKQSNIDQIQQGMEGFAAKQQKFSDAQEAAEEAQAEEQRLANLSFPEKFKLGLQDKETVFKLGLLMTELGNKDPDRESAMLNYGEVQAKNAAASAPSMSEHTAFQISNKDLMTRFTREKSFMSGIGVGSSKEDRERQATTMLGLYRSIEKALHSQGYSASDVEIMAELKRQVEELKGIA